MSEPVDETQPGLGPVKKRFNKKLLLSAVVAGVIVAMTKLWPQYADLIDGIRQGLGF